MCPLCGLRRAKRWCPGLNQTICAVCCGTKRLVEIRCPDSCVYLAGAREHPPAAAVRQQRSDVALLTQALHDLNDRQAQLLVAICRRVVTFEPPELHRLVDQDVEQAAAALASTLETATRGVIYEHAAPSASANRLAAELRPLLQKAVEGGGTSAERDAAVALRKFETLVKASRTEGSGERRFLSLLERIIDSRGTLPAAERDVPRLIVP
jgi:hypothetical protein